MQGLRAAQPSALTSGLVLALALPGTAWAHGFGKPVSLPVPFWLYASGALLALVLTFVLAGLSLRQVKPASSVGDAGGSTQGRMGLRAHRPFLRWSFLRRTFLGRTLQGLPVLGLFVLAVWAGLVGVRNPFANISMTLFWVGFVLIVPYLAACLGNINAWANPFYALPTRLAAIRRGPWAGLGHRLRQGFMAYPSRLASWPALALYMVFIWIELFGHTLPRGLAFLLMGYMGLTLLGCLVFGTQTWLRHGECFARLIRLLGPIAPRFSRNAHGQWQLRWPFEGLMAVRLGHVSELVFLLFLLTATSFDGLHNTAPWVRLFWTDLLNLWSPLLAPPMVQHYLLLTKLFAAWQRSWLVLMPLLYGLVFWCCMHLAARWTGSQIKTSELVRRFGFTLMPIILVYHLGHYLDLLVTQGTQLIPMISDPLGRGWNLLGTAQWVRPVIRLAPETTWHLQVALIVVGHGVSVWMAHLRALELFGRPWLALKSQLPMLVFMMGLTLFGLWILAQPFAPPGAALLPAGA